MIFDTHAHYEDQAFDSDREILLGQLPKSGIGCVVNVSSTPSSLEKTENLMEQWPYVYGAFGIHPDSVGEIDGQMEERLRAYCQKPKTVAVGEIGLDYHWGKENRETQIAWFEKQLKIAKEERLPVIIHSRDAAQDTLEVARRCHLEEIGGVMHCYSYSPEMARIYLDMGLYLGIGGVVTFKNARRLKEVVREMPLDRLVLETDCPYLAPEPHRGRRNFSGNLPYVIRAIAEIRDITREEVEEAAWNNARNLYRLDETD